VQCPQEFYNKGAFDDDGFTGEQGLFFNVLMPARHHAGAGPFWCGSTSLLRVEALREIGGVATETVTEDMHTTLKLLQLGWRTVYHHQTVAVGLAPGTAEQYLIQRRRWGMGAMQILRQERLWTAKRWLSWRNFYEYLTGTLWWLEGIATLMVFGIPLTILVTGVQTSTAQPLTFTAIFASVFSVRLWGAKRLLRGHIQWRTAFALRVFRVPIGLACAWSLASRRSLEFEVTPKAGVEDRYRGKVPRILWALTCLTVGVCLYAVAGVLHLVPWRPTPASTVASGLWILLAGVVLVCGLRRIRSPRFASTRRDAPRVPFAATVRVDSLVSKLIDISVGGASVCLPAGADRPSGTGRAAPTRRAADQDGGRTDHHSTRWRHHPLSACGRGRLGVAPTTLTMAVPHPRRRRSRVARWGPRGRGDAGRDLFRSVATRHYHDDDDPVRRPRRRGLGSCRRVNKRLEPDQGPETSGRSQPPTL
jgi:cellulose synthase (UDP-forming)